MKNSSEKTISPRRYHQLFTGTIIFYLVAIFLNLGEVGQFLMGVGFCILILLAIRTFPLSAFLKIVFRVLTIGILTIGIGRLLLSEGLIKQSLGILSLIIYGFFLTLAIMFLSSKIFAAKTVNKDTLLGGISIYLLFGFLWYIIYYLVYLYDNNAFSDIGEDPGYYLLYFSFTTLTTLGYGDITPVNKVAMGFTNIEAIVGQLYPAIFLAQLVSLYIESDLE